MSALNIRNQAATVKTAEMIMRRHLISLFPEANLFRAVGELLKENVSGAPVIGDDGTYLGVLSEKRCITALTNVVERARDVGMHDVKAREFMATDLVTLQGETDVFDAIDDLLSQRISGAPVVDHQGRFRGVFSEKTAMRVLSSALLEGLPGTRVESYMNVDQNRIIGENDLLIDVAQKFMETPYRRLPVLRDGQLVGQVSRRDVLRAEHRLAGEVIGQSGNTKTEDEHPNIDPGLVGDFMDLEAMTAAPTTDLLGITQMFLNSPYRRLPIVNGTELVGQISRRDLLEVAASMIRQEKTCGQAETLYLSGVSASEPPSFA